MHKFEIAIQILEEIIDKKIPFNIATKTFLDKYSVDKAERGPVLGIIGCELRHHMLFECLVKDNFDYPEGTNLYPIYLSMANACFYKKFDEQEVDAITLRATKLDRNKYLDFINQFKDKEDLVPEKFPKGSFEYLSLRYNCPLWLVKMLNKHYGRGLAFQILRSNYRQPVHSYKCNGISVEEVIKDTNFVAAPISDMVIYSGKGNIKQNELVKTNKLLPIKMTYKDILDRVNLPEIGNVALFMAYSNSFYIDLLKRVSKSVKIDVIADSVSLYSEVKRCTGLYHFPKFNLIEAKASSLLACISEKVDTLVIMARNSNIDLLKSTPDYFLSINRNDLDSIIKEQRYTLEEAAELVNDSGELVYLIPTLNKKESKEIIRDFLLLHRDYSLLEEKQYFPFEETDASLYAARLIRTGKK